MTIRSPVTLTQACVALETQRREIIGDTLHTAHDALNRWREGLMSDDEALGLLALMIVPATALHRFEPPVTDEEIARDREQSELVPSDTGMNNRSFKDRFNLSTAAWHAVRTYRRVGELAAVSVNEFRGGLVPYDEAIVEEVHSKLGPTLSALSFARKSWSRPYTAP